MKKDRKRGQQQDVRKEEVKKKNNKKFNERFVESGEKEKYLS